MAKRTTWSKPVGHPEWLYRFNKAGTVLTIRKAGTGPVLTIPVPKHFPYSLATFASVLATQLASADLQDVEYRAEVTESPVLILNNPETTNPSTVRNGQDHRIPYLMQTGRITHKSLTARDRDLTGPYPPERMNSDAYLGRLNQ